MKQTIKKAKLSLKDYVTRRVNERFGMQLSDMEYMLLNSLACDSDPINISYKDPNCDFRKIKGEVLGLEEDMVVIWDRKINSIKTVLYSREEKEFENTNVEELIKRQSFIKNRKDPALLKKNERVHGNIIKQLHESSFLVILEEYNTTAIIIGRYLEESDSYEVGQRLKLRVHTAKKNASGELKVYVTPNLGSKRGKKRYHSN